MPAGSALAAPAEDKAPAKPAAEAPEADADATPSVTDRAVAAFESGDFDTAIELFEQAYTEDGDPNYLFNIGRVFEEKGDLRSAIDRYEKFVNSPGVEIDSRKFANERLVVLRDIIAAEDQAKAEEEQRIADAEAAKRRQDEGEDEGPSAAPLSQADITRKRTRTIGFVLMGLGAAAAAGGGAAGGIALGRHNDFENETDPDKAADLKQSGQSLSSAADGLFIAGGVVAVAGLVMVLTTLDKKTKDKKAARTNLQPQFGRTGAGLSLSHRF